MEPSTGALEPNFIFHRTLVSSVRTKDWSCPRSWTKGVGNCASMYVRVFQNRAASVRSSDEGARACACITWGLTLLCFSCIPRPCKGWVSGCACSVSTLAARAPFTPTRMYRPSSCKQVTAVGESHYNICNNRCTFAIFRWNICNICIKTDETFETYILKHRCNMSNIPIYFWNIQMHTCNIKRRHKTLETCF
jgi:hypothetical protein